MEIYSRKKDTVNAIFIYKSQSYNFMQFSPSEKEVKKINDVATEIISKIKLKDTVTILGGSGAKNTWLSDTHDLDIFVKFNYSKYNDKSDKLSNLLHPVLKKKFKRITRLHGSRDYFQIKYKGYNIELIPILDIRTYAEAKNITDVSPLHIEWVGKNIRGLADDIRKAKLFCMANNLYGAESYIKGFSGYVLEILIIHYGSFLNLLKAASKWKPKEVIDIYDVHKDPFSDLNISKIQSPLILIDPVQPDRNASAALSQEKYEKFKQLAIEYLKHPSDELFKHKSFTKQSISKKFKTKEIIMLEAVLKKDKPDIAGAKVLKAFEHIGKSLLKNEFILVHADIQFANNKAIMYYAVDKKKLSLYKKHYGPPLDKEKHLQAFKNAWKSYKIEQEGNKVYVNIKRQYLTPLNLVKYLIKQKDIKELSSIMKIV